MKKFHGVTIASVSVLFLLPELALAQGTFIMPGLDLYGFSSVGPTPPHLMYLGNPLVRTLQIMENVDLEAARPVIESETDATAKKGMTKNSDPAAGEPVTYDPTAEGA